METSPDCRDIKQESDDQHVGGHFFLDSVTTLHPDDSQGTLSMVNSVVIDCSTDEQGEISIMPSVQAKGPSDVDISTDLPQDQKDQVRDILNSFPDVLTDLPCYTNILQHDIKLSTDIPVRMKSRPIPYD